MSVDLKALLLALTGVVLVTTAFGAAPKKARMDSGRPINIYARTIEFDDKTGVAWYRGDVSITDGELSIKADRVQVLTREGEIEIFKAFGDPVDIKRRASGTQPEIKAKSQRAIYNTKTQKLDMFGKVELYQQGSELHCAEVHYDMQTGRFVGKADQDQERCYVVMQPKDKEEQTTGKGAINQ
jgi:lipopolysaccharide export system protein LptA